MSHETTSPWPELAAWFDEARASRGIRYPAAMCLSTVSALGRPEGRFVLVEELDEDGFVFLTDERSPKARSLAAHPWAALTLYWGASLERQIRAEGRVFRADEATADRLFERRPVASRAVAWVSSQSEKVGNRGPLEEAIAAFDRNVSSPGRPPHWRAYRLAPDRVELWRARARRLHERVLYERMEDGLWRRSLLLP